ncbi:unnamed protein product, partial [Urochloa humidicola]
DEVPSGDRSGGVAPPQKKRSSPAWRSKGRLWQGGRHESASDEEPDGRPSPAARRPDRLPLLCGRGAAGSSWSRMARGGRARARSGGAARVTAATIAPLAGVAPSFQFDEGRIDASHAMRPHPWEEADTVVASCPC